MEKYMGRKKITVQKIFLQNCYQSMVKGLISLVRSHWWPYWHDIVASIWTYTEYSILEKKNVYRVEYTTVHRINSRKCMDFPKVEWLEKIFTTFSIKSPCHLMSEAPQARHELYIFFSLVPRREIRRRSQHCIPTEPRKRWKGFCTELGT